MSEHDLSNTTTNPQHALILKLIQEKVAAKLDDLENNRHSNDSLLETLQAEIKELIESGTNINNSLQKPEIVEGSGSPKAKPGVKINTDENAQSHVPKSKVPSTTKEAKTGSTEEKDAATDAKGRRPSHPVGKSDKPQSLNNLTEEKKVEATPKTTKKTTEPPKTTTKTTTEKEAPKKPEKPAVKKGTTDTKKKEEGHEEEKHEEGDNAADQDQPPEVLALRDANKSLKALSSKELGEVVASAKPPAGVEKVVGAVLTVIGEKEAWINAKKVLKSADFIKKLAKVNAESLSATVTKKVRGVLGEPDNQEDNIVKVSATAGVFVKWLNCLIKVRDLKKGPESAAEIPEKENAPEEKIEHKEEGHAEHAEEKKEEHANAEGVADKDENSEEALIEACKNALKPLDFNKVQMATATPNPPPKLVKVFEVICTILGEKASWDNAKKVAKLKDFLKKLENLKPEGVNAKNFTKAKQVIADEGLKPEVFEKGNAAVKQLCLWVTSFVKLRELKAGPEGAEAHEGNEEHNNEHAEEKKEGEKEEKDAKESAKKDVKKGAEPKKEAKKPAVTAPKKDEKKDDKTAKGKPVKKDEKKDEKKEGETGEEKAEHAEEKKEEGEAKHGEEAAKKDVKKGTTAKTGTDAKAPSTRPSTTTKKDEKKDEKKEKEDKAKDAKKEDKGKDKEKAPKEEKKTATKPAETKKTEKQTAKPELKAILDTITGSDLKELMAMAKPVAQIVDTVNLVSLLIQGKENAWADAAKAYLNNTVTLHKALNIDLSAIPQENIDAVNKKITDSNLDEATLKKKSSACVALFKWVKEAIKISEQSKHAAEEAKEQNGVAHPHEEGHEAQEVVKKEGEAEAEAHAEPHVESHAEPHLNGEQAHSGDNHHQEEAEKKEEPAKAEEEEKKKEINLEEAFEKLSEALGYNVRDEVTDGNLEHYVKEKFNELENNIKTLNAQNAELKNAGVPENVDKNKQFASNESTSELLKSVQQGSVAELLGQENWDEKTNNILALVFLIKGNHDVPSQSEHDKFKAYVKEKLEHEEDPAGFLTKLGENINLDTQKKIELQHYLQGKHSILEQNHFEGANDFAKGAAVITREVCEHLGVVPAENATEVSVKERVYAFNEEKIAAYNLKENKIIDIAHKYNIALDS